MPDTLPHSISVNPEQRAIIDHLREQPLTVVSAGAGAGKTYTTVAAIVELLGRREASADQFVLITFTNQAADHLRLALQKALTSQIVAAQANPLARAYWLEQRELLSCAFVGTIHRFCRKILSQHGYGAGVSKDAAVSFSVRLRNEVIEHVLEAWLGAQPLFPLAEQVRSGAYPVYAIRKLLSRMLEQVRNQGLRTADLLLATQGRADEPGKDSRVELAGLLAGIEHGYQEACREAQQLDAAALLEKTWELLTSQAGDHVVRVLAERFRFLFIDEFQDTTETQAAIVDVLASRMRVLVVGDKKQSIYGFTGAQVSLLEDFAEKRDADILLLRMSGRPTLPLLEAQNALFRKMRERFRELDEPLLPNKRNHPAADALPPICVILEPDGRPASLQNATTRIANMLGKEMDRPQEDGGRRPIRPADMAVLVRTNSEVSAWVQLLEEAGIPARSDNGISYLRQPEIVAMYRFLQLLSRYPDDVALVEALSTPHFKGIDLQAEEADILAFGVQRGRPLTVKYERSHQDHAQKVRALIKQSHTATVPQLLGLVERAFELKAYYRKIGLDSAAVNLDRLRDYARNRFNSDQALTLRAFLSMLQRDIIQDQETGDPNEQASDGEGQVVVMTIHRSKGLEFPVVILPGIEKDRQKKHPPEFVVDKELGLELNVRELGLTPSTGFQANWQQAQQRLLAEEMRLFYVAVTRARHMVCMFGVQPQDGGGTSWARSWQNELLAARQEMRQYGARFFVVPADGSHPAGRTA